MDILNVGLLRLPNRNSGSYVPGPGCAAALGARNRTSPPTMMPLRLGAVGLSVLVCVYRPGPGTAAVALDARNRAAPLEISPTPEPFFHDWLMSYAPGGGTSATWCSGHRGSRDAKVAVGARAVEIRARIDAEQEAVHEDSCRADGEEEDSQYRRLGSRPFHLRFA